MLISIVLLSVSGILLLAADGLAQLRLGRPQGGVVGRVGLAMPLRPDGGGFPSFSTRGKIEGTNSLGASHTAQPQTAKRT